ncbi:MAG: hypothetical protein M3040_17020 [Bacteroidota bacterium]|nr:hypothetical protein [Bacteroidota bacterium]
MKKMITLGTAALLFAGAAFSQEGKKCAKGKDCCNKKEIAKKSSDNKIVKSTASLRKA